MLNSIAYTGPVSIEWEDAGMDRLIGAPQALAVIRQLQDIRPASEAFDTAFGRKQTSTESATPTHLPTKPPTQPRRD
jgi:hypothetical protein